MAAADKLDQRGHGEIRRAHEHQAERQSRLHLLASCRLGEFLDDAVALELGHMVDEQHAVDVVDLVLQAGRQQALGLDLVRLAVEIEIFDLDLRPAARPPRNIPGSTGSLPRMSAFPRTSR